MFVCVCVFVCLCVCVFGTIFVKKLDKKLLKSYRIFLLNPFLQAALPLFTRDLADVHGRSRKVNSHS